MQNNDPLEILQNLPSLLLGNSRAYAQQDLCPECQGANVWSSNTGSGCWTCQAHDYVGEGDADE